ncbi:MAG: NUDIX hydrolase [Victivallaceae bacterium]|nr:NUDIX hydrolase [Victivallaceae bacterium]
MARIISKNVVASMKFLTLSKIEFVDDHGKNRTWESADRVGGAGAVLIVATIVPQDEILLVRQFRPPTGRQMLEFPAGLIDAGEDAGTAALRELMEETGYEGRLVRVTNPGYSSAGMSGESIAVAFVEIDGTKIADVPIVAHPEENEIIDCFRVRKNRLGDFIAEQEAIGVGIDTKLYLFA